MKRTQEQRDLIMAYKTAFGTEAGKSVLADLRKKSGLDQPFVTLGEPIDMPTVLYHEAQRAVILYVINKLQANLDDNDSETARTEETM